MNAAHLTARIHAARRHAALAFSVHVIEGDSGEIAVDIAHLFEELEMIERHVETDGKSDEIMLGATEQ
jgi:hypothetical protein